MNLYKSGWMSSIVQTEFWLYQIDFNNFLKTVSELKVKTLGILKHCIKTITNLGEYTFYFKNQPFFILFL